MVAPKTPNTMSYNGWTNYETWCVKLWMDNDQGSYEYWQEILEEMDEESDPDSLDIRVRELADCIEAQHEHLREELGMETGPFSDILGAAMSQVNWEEIALSLIEDAGD